MRDLDRLPLLEVMTGRLDPCQRRAGAGGGQPWWLCPFHDDRNPSLTITPDGAHWRCFACDAGGDSIDLIRKLDPTLSFPEALAEARGEIRRTKPSVTAGRRQASISGAIPAVRPAGWTDLARRVADSARDRLWSVDGSEGLAHLRTRGLEDATIQSAGLGYVARDVFDRGVDADRPFYIPAGITIPWEETGIISALNVRRLVRDGKRKYHLMRGSRRSLYPSRLAIVPGRPLILCEGEFDCLLLAQEVGSLASVVTLGSASDRRPDVAVSLALATCSPWYIAGDNDAAGKVNAEGWLTRSARCRRIAPPGKDWTSCFQEGYRLGEWWKAILGGSDPNGLESDPDLYEPSPTLTVN